MEIYLVGGAVRDELLGRPVRERDWVVVGATPDEMTALGYRQVGRDFPVFLHPDTGEEHALARTERKTGPGHTGFVCHAGPDVTLEDDLARRDLTVNAMARDASGALVDPFDGKRDLENRVLRHVSDAFVEDPLRVFRVARFAAQLPGFSVAPETASLMTRMARRGELAELAAERVWQELHKALAAEAPRRFFEVLAGTDAMAPWLVELAQGPWELPAALESPEQRFAALTWNLEPRAVSELCERLKVPNRFRNLAEQVAEHGTVLGDWSRRPPERVLAGLAAIGALDRHRDPEPALRVVAARGGVRLERLRRVAAELEGLRADPLREQGYTGKALGEAIRRARLELIAAVQGGENAADPGGHER
ncbi:MAG: multifunctional CCA tRNA nucleotidyl transferase/2'3'-cyclic phosphodiesterase/2'nucleotidase/phosphatase [Pseudomonadota bacterium]